MEDDFDLEEDWLSGVYEHTEVKNFNDFRAAKDAQQEALFLLVDEITSVIEADQQDDAESDQDQTTSEQTSTLTA